MTQEGTDAGPRGDQSDDSSSSYNDSFDNDDIPTDLSFRFAETRQRESATQTGRYTGPWGKGNFHYIENSKGQVPITKKCINEAKDRYGAIPTCATVTFKTFINTQGIKFVYEFEILYDADSQILPMQGFISKIEDSSHVIVMPYRPSEPSSVFSKEKIVVCPFTMTTLDSSQLTNQTMISFVTRISSKPSQGIQGLTLRGSITAAIGQRPPKPAPTQKLPSAPKNFVMIPDRHIEEFLKFNPNFDIVAMPPRLPSLNEDPNGQQDVTAQGIKTQLPSASFIGRLEYLAPAEIFKTCQENFNKSNLLLLPPINDTTTTTKFIKSNLKLNPNNPKSIFKQIATVTIILPCGKNLNEITFIRNQYDSIFKTQYTDNITVINPPTTSIDQYDQGYCAVTFSPNNHTSFPTICTTNPTPTTITNITIDNNVIATTAVCAKDDHKFISIIDSLAVAKHITNKSNHTKSFAKEHHFTFDTDINTYKHIVHQLAKQPNRAAFIIPTQTLNYSADAVLLTLDPRITNLDLRELPCYTDVYFCKQLDSTSFLLLLHNAPNKITTFAQQLVKLGQIYKIQNPTDNIFPFNYIYSCHTHIKIPLDGSPTASYWQHENNSLIITGFSPDITPNMIISIKNVLIKHLSLPNDTTFAEIFTNKTDASLGICFTSQTLSNNINNNTNKTAWISLNGCPQLLSINTFNSTLFNITDTHTTNTNSELNLTDLDFSNRESENSHSPSYYSPTTKKVFAEALTKSYKNNTYLSQQQLLHTHTHN
jgi:hypothetical protein